MIEIICQNTNQKILVKKGTSLQEIFNQNNIKLKFPVLGARVNNSIKELSYSLYKPKTIEFFDYTNKDGQRIYLRTLYFILCKAAQNILPKNQKIKIDHSISRGVYCEILDFDDNLVKTDSNQAQAIFKEMQKIVKAKIDITREELLSTEIAQIYQNLGLNDKADLFANRNRLYSSIYTLDGMQDYFYGYLCPNTSYITKFDVVDYYDGILIRYPDQNFELEPITNQDKLFEVFREHKKWGKLLGVNTVSQLNHLVDTKKSGDLIKVSEALHEKKIAKIADMITQTGKTRLVLIAGPSSSGKTTFSKRLCVQLMVSGLKPIQISLDDYFVNRVDTPKDENGNYDYETIEALDYNQFGQDMIDLMAGKTVTIPTYNFLTGEREYTKEPITADNDTVFVVEGIHGLNPKLSSMVPPENKFKIYISALTQIAIDNHNRIPTTDNRLLRRIIRDFQYRNYSAEETIKRWPDVRKGEDKYIFPFQEEADVMFNSALLYELGVIKTFVEPVLRGVNETSPTYSEAQRLLKFLSFIKNVNGEEIPPTSIVREFLSGSSFE